MCLEGFNDDEGGFPPLGMRLVPVDIMYCFAAPTPPL
jgi:hypothetical protein